MPAPDDLFTELEILRPPQALDYRRISSLFGCCSQGAFKKGKSGLQRHLHYGVLLRPIQGYLRRGHVVRASVFLRQPILLYEGGSVHSIRLLKYLLAGW